MRPLAALDALAELALPRTCAGCGRSGVSLCRTCDIALDRPLLQDAASVQPLPCPDGMPPTWSQVPYAGAPARALRVHKDAGRSDLAPRLARLLRAAVAGAVEHDAAVAAAVTAGEPVLVIPMPTRAASVRARGGDPMLTLTRLACSGAVPLRLVSALRVSGRGRDQAGLSALERAVNVRNSMAVRGRWARVVDGATCVIADDIVTTGSSLTEAARALRQAGAAHVAAATVASTVRHAGR